MRKELKKKSKFLSLVLRHKPETIDLKLDENGWADVQELLDKTRLDPEELKEIVETNDKKRFTFNDDESKIRASQGHSIDVDLQLEPKDPLPVLYHGTATKNIDSILRDGLKKANRQHVLLSADQETAIKVGQRHGKPIILTINAKLMAQDGYKFFLSKNGVWLTDSVPVDYIGVLPPQGEKND